MRALGVDVYEHGADTLRVFGQGPARASSRPGAPIDCANAGTLVRLLAGILAGQAGETFELTGDESLSRAPDGADRRAARPHGRALETTDGHLPMRIRAARSVAIDYALPVASAQVKSAILLAGPVRRRRDDRRRAGADARPHRADAERGRRARHRPPDERHGAAGRAARAGRGRGARRLLLRGAVRRRGDAGSRLRAPRPRRQPQPAPHRAAGRSSSGWGRTSRSTTAAQIGGEPGGDLEVHSRRARRRPPSARRRCRSRSTSCRCSPSRPHARAARACSAARRSSGRRRPTGSRRRSTRCVRSGVRARATEDGFAITGVPARLRGGRIASRGDHRIAMLGRSPASRRGRAFAIEGADASSVSFPGFFDVVERLRRSTRNTTSWPSEARPALRAFPADGREPDDRRDRRARRRRQELGGEGARRPARLPLPRHRGDVPRAHLARAARGRRRSTTGPRSRRSPRANPVEFGDAGQRVDRGRGRDGPRSASRRSTRPSRSSHATPRCGR